MRPSSMRYLFVQGVSSLWKNRMMTLASIGILTACLLIVGFAILLTENLNEVMGFVESQNEIVAFMHKSDEPEALAVYTEDVTPANIKTALQIQKDFTASAQTEDDFRHTLLESNITQADLTMLFGEQSIKDFVPPENSEKKAGYPVIYWPHLIQKTEALLNEVDNVSSVRFVSKSQGLEQLQGESFGEMAYLFEGYTGEENPLSHSFVLTIDDLALLDETLPQLESIEGIKLVKASTIVATTLVSVRRIVNLIGWSIVFALCVVSLVIIINTIRASIFTRRKEINIMKYVGATNAFIRIPFLIEGFFLGLLATATAYLLIFGGYTLFFHYFNPDATSWITQVFSQIIPFEQIALKLAVFFAISGLGLGILGSTLSMRNYIKV